MPPEPTLEERIEVAMEHLRLMVAFESGEIIGSGLAAPLRNPTLTPSEAELRACRHLRGQIPLYVKGVPGAAQVRNRLTKCSSVVEYERELSSLLQSDRS